MLPPGWQKRAWCEDAAACLNGIVGDVEKARADVESDRAELLAVTGEGYGGWLLLELRRGPGGMVAWVHAFAGFGAAEGLRDLERVAREAGAVALVCQAETPVLWRLYRRIGWIETARFFERGI